MNRHSRVALVALLAATIVWMTAARASTQDVSGVRSEVDYSFGQMMRFALDARDLGDVEQITLYFRVNTSTDSFAVDLPFEAGSRVEVEHVLDLTQTRLPPFSTITYWWELRRGDGATLRVPEQTVSYVDDQFDWQQLEVTDEQGGGSLRIHWTDDDPIAGTAARSIILDQLVTASQVLPLEQIAPFDAYIYPSTADLGAALRLAGFDYVPGQTYPEQAVLLLTAVNPQTAEAELRPQLARGLTDLLLFQAVGQRLYTLPAWLRSGLARVVELDQTEFAETSSDDTRPLFADLCAGAAVDEAGASGALRFLERAYGSNAIRSFVREMADGKPCAEALAMAISLTPEQADAAWRRSSGAAAAGGAQAAQPSLVLLPVVLVGLLVAGLIVWRSR